jgi:hypothetical protein
MQAKTLVTWATVGFAVGTASLASSSTVQTLPAVALHNMGFEVDAGIVGGSWASTGIVQIYVDGYAYSGGSMLLDLIRYSYSGTRTETAASVSFAAGQFEVSLASPVMLTSPSQWDYYTFLMNGSPNEFTSQVSLDGIGVVSH